MTEKNVIQTDKPSVSLSNGTYKKNFVLTGLTVSAYKTGTVTYEGITKERSGGVSISRGGRFLCKLSGFEASFLMHLFDDPEFLGLIKEIKADEIKVLSSE